MKIGVTLADFQSSGTTPELYVCCMISWLVDNRFHLSVQVVISFLIIVEEEIIKAISRLNLPPVSDIVTRDVRPGFPHPPPPKKRTSIKNVSVGAVA